MWQKEHKISLAFFYTQDFSLGIILPSKKGKLKMERKRKNSARRLENPRQV